MDILNKSRKAQGLPLNTIVIAILVIIVLLVIVVFFTTNVGKSGEQLDQNSVGQCSEDNPALATLGYTDYEEINEDETCEGALDETYRAAIGVANCCVK